MSLRESDDKLQWASDVTEQNRFIKAYDHDNGANNMDVVKQISGWQTKYPAFKWCADFGEGWYLPAINELKKFTVDQSVHDAVNQTLATNGVKLPNEEDGVKHWYWSSTQDGNYDDLAWTVGVGVSSGVHGSLGAKYWTIYVRAVARF